jgi:hypothetical protein
VEGDQPLHGLRKMWFKLARARVPRALPALEAWIRMLSPP